MNIVLRNMQSPGDVLMLTAALRDIKRWYPHWEIDVKTSTDALWENNPYITRLTPGDVDMVLGMEYPAIHESNQNKEVHFIHGFIKFINEKLNLQVKLTEFKPDIHLTDEEKEKKLPGEPDEPFWIFVAGGKEDYPHKAMWTERWQEIVDHLDGIPLVQSGGSDEGHFHYTMKGDHVTNMVGKTPNMRDLMGLIYRSVGVISHVTFHMHLAMALDSYAVTVAGGLEPPNWEAYPTYKHKYVHTIGELPCCGENACWKLKNCENLEDGKQKCFDIIDMEYVAGCVRQFHERYHKDRGLEFKPYKPEPKQEERIVRLDEAKKKTPKKAKDESEKSE